VRKSLIYILPTTDKIKSEAEIRKEAPRTKKQEPNLSAVADKTCLPWRIQTPNFKFEAKCNLNTQVK
jgi:hypothetical protein